MMLFHRPIPTVPLVVALAVVVLTPAAGVLWFMKEAMVNQQLAARQKLAEAYRNHLLLVRDRLDAEWVRESASLDHEADVLSPDALFARAIRFADSAVCYRPDGERVYPAPPKISVPDASPSWSEARRLEDAGDLLAAANAYAAIGGPQALQAQTRCLARAGKRKAAIELVWKHSDALPQLELLALRLMAGEDSRRLPLARRMQAKLTDYGSGLSGGERLFLMRALQNLKVSDFEFPTLRAEELAARVVENADAAGIWKLWSPHKRVLLLFETKSLAARIDAWLNQQTASGGVTLLAAAPGERAPADSLELASYPGWRIALAASPDQLTGAQQRTLWYLWIGCLAIAGTSIAAVLVGQTVRRQVQLAGVKADLVATVSHELRTPVSSTRLLVDTLLEQSHPDPLQTREYLQMISRENERLSHLIDQFLTFSRMERKKHVFEFAEVRPEQVARAAVDAVRDRLESCQFQQEIGEDLPPIRADEPALVTALVNLLENAWKYSPDEKRIALRVFTGEGFVRFAVQDHGIGIPPRENHKIFRKFYQTDQALSRRAGGVGLGLSIVRLVVEAHKGTVEVESRPGEGSTFTISVAAT
jgi:signal transduction histidine kinase